MLTWGFQASWLLSLFLVVVTVGRHNFGSFHKFQLREWERRISLWARTKQTRNSSWDIFPQRPNTWEPVYWTLKACDPQLLLLDPRTLHLQPLDRNELLCGHFWGSPCFLSDSTAWLNWGAMTMYGIEIRGFRSVMSDTIHFYATSVRWCFPPTPYGEGFGDSPHGQSVGTAEACVPWFAIYCVDASVSIRTLKDYQREDEDSFLVNPRVFLRKTVNLSGLQFPSCVTLGLKHGSQGSSGSDLQDSLGSVLW